jgi:DNA-binding NtrC family response regulator
MKKTKRESENLKGVCVSILSERSQEIKPVATALSKEGCIVHVAKELDELRKLTTKEPSNVLIIDTRLCEEFVKTKAEHALELENMGSEIVVFSEESDTSEAFHWVRLLRGYSITLPISREEITVLLERALDARLLKKRLARYEAEEPTLERFGPIVVRSPEMKDVIRLSRILANRNDCVLFVGGVGTGKELLAQTIHEHSPRRYGPFYYINCRSFSSEDLAVEIFGRGEPDSLEAKEEKNLLEISHGGTLFLDEISVISPNVQGKLQRFLEDGTYTRVNSRTVCKCDVRIMAAISRSLDEEVAKGEFSEEVFFRLNRFTLHSPALRRRSEDIPILTKSILQRISKDKGEHGCKITEDTLKLLMDYPWPGNVRELENVLEFAALVADDEPITPKHLPKQFQDEVGSIFLGSSVDDLPPLSEIERRYIIRVMDATKGNKVKAATLLDINRATLHRKLQMYEEEKVSDLL